MRTERKLKFWFWVTAIAMMTTISLPAWAERDWGDGYLYAQIGPTFGMVDESFTGDYEDTIGLNGRIGARGEYTGVELHVEGLPGSVVQRSENSKSKGEGIVSVTLNLKFIYDIGPFEPYVVAGIGLLTLTEVIFIAALNPDDEEIRTEDEKIDFHARAGIGVQFPVAPHVYGFLEGAWNGGSNDLERYNYLSLTSGVGIRF